MASFALLSTLLASSAMAYPQAAAPPDNTVYRQSPSFNIIVNNIGATPEQAAIFPNGSFANFYHVSAADDRIQLSQDATHKIDYYLNGTDLTFGSDAATLQFPAAPSNGFPYFGVVVKDSRPAFEPLRFGAVSGSQGWFNFSRPDGVDGLAYAPVAQGGQLYGCRFEGIDVPFLSYGGAHVDPAVPDNCAPAELSALFLGSPSYA